MLKVNIQLFAHKKGMGSTKNGRDSDSKRLGVERADGLPGCPEIESKAKTSSGSV